MLIYELRGMILFSPCSPVYSEGFDPQPDGFLWNYGIPILDGYPLVIKHGFLENEPFSSVLFPAN